MNENDIWLIAGLGNPEAKYDGTRHNAGFAALDALADKWNISVGKTKFQGLWGQGEVDGHKVVLLKPLTYMNLSGDSIAPMAGFFKIPADHVLVLCDDITQAPGKLRIRPSGSAGGHNGLKSIIARLGGENFPRIRIGIGAKPHPDYDQYYVHGRTVFEVMVRITDDIFNTYLRKRGTVNPYYSEYCDGMVSSNWITQYWPGWSISSATRSPGL